MEEIEGKFRRKLNELRKQKGNISKAMFDSFIQLLGPMGVPVSILSKYSELKESENRHKLLLELIDTIKTEYNQFYIKFRGEYDELYHNIREKINKQSKELNLHKDILLQHDLINNILSTRLSNVEGAVDRIGGVVYTKGNSTIISAPNSVNSAFAAIQRRDYVRGMYHSKQAIIENPNDNNGYTNMGAALAGLGYFDEALEYFKRAVELNDRDLNAWLNQAEVRRHIRDISNAKKCYEKVLEISPSNNQAKKRLQELKS